MASTAASKSRVARKCRLSASLGHRVGKLFPQPCRTLDIGEQERHRPRRRILQSAPSCTRPSLTFHIVSPTVSPHMQYRRHDPANGKRATPCPAFSTLATAWLPEFSTAIAHLRDVLGDEVYESLASQGETMTTATITTYAYDQIDRARTELDAVSK